jgi:hypothetical protein
LLVIDGDSFAHRSYHALPKTIRRSDGWGAGAILGFANFLLRFTQASSLVPSLSAGTVSKRRRNAAKCFRPINPGESSTKI